MISLGFSKSNLLPQVEQNFASNANKAFKPFNERHYRENLKRLTGMDPPSKIEAHHVFPQAMRDEFLKKGINIDDPKFLTWWERALHRQAANDYNKEWRIFLRDNPEVTESQILEKGRQLMQKYGMDVQF